MPGETPEPLSLGFFGFFSLFGLALGAFLQTFAEVRHGRAKFAANARYPSDAEEQNDYRKNQKKFGSAKTSHYVFLARCCESLNDCTTLAGHLESRSPMRAGHAPPSAK